ncbi:hypothetical protein C0995_000494, partial [Termitomyces sp. Mi166
YIEGLENRIKKLEELLVRISPEALEQLDNSPATPTQQQQPLQPLLDPQQYCLHQTTSQPPLQKQYNTYVQPCSNASLQAQLPVSVPSFGQSYRPAMYIGNPATMSSSILPRAGETGLGGRPEYLYWMGAAAAGNVVMDVDMNIRQRTGDVGLRLNPLGSLEQNVNETFTI